MDQRQQLERLKATHGPNAMIDMLMGNESKKVSIGEALQFLDMSEADRKSLPSAVVPDPRQLPQLKPPSATDFGGMNNLMQGGVNPNITPSQKLYEITMPNGEVVRLPEAEALALIEQHKARGGRAKEEGIYYESEVQTPQLSDSFQYAPPGGMVAPPIAQATPGKGGLLSPPPMPPEAQLKAIRDRAASMFQGIQDSLPDDVIELQLPNGKQKIIQANKVMDYINGKGIEKDLGLLPSDTAESFQYVSPEAPYSPQPAEVGEARLQGPPVKGGTFNPPMKDSGFFRPANEDPAMIALGRTLSKVGAQGKDWLYKLMGDERGRELVAEQEAENDRMYSKLQDTNPIATTFGEVAPGLAIPGGFLKAGASKIPMLANTLSKADKFGLAASKATRAGANAIAKGTGVTAEAAAVGALEGGLRYGESAGEGALWGAAGAKGGQAIGRLLGKAPTQLNQSQQKLADWATDQKYFIPPGLRYGNRTIQQLDSALKNRAGLTGLWDEKIAQNQEITNRIAGKLVGIDDATELTAETIAGRASQIGSEMDELAATTSGKAFPKDILNLENLVSEFKKRAPGNKRAVKALQGFKDQVYKQLGQGGTLSGTDYQELSSILKDAARNELTGASGNRLLGKAISDMKRTLDTMVEQGMDPTAVQKWRNLNRQYAFLDDFERRGLNRGSSQWNKAGDFNASKMFDYYKVKDYKRFGRMATPTKEARKSMSSWERDLSDLYSATKFADYMRSQAPSSLHMGQTLTDITGGPFFGKGRAVGGINKLILGHGVSAVPWLNEMATRLHFTGLFSGGAGLPILPRGASTTLGQIGGRTLPLYEGN